MDSLRTYIYVDGFNFYYGKLKNSSYKWLDLETFFTKSLKPNNQILKIKYFTARIDQNPRNPQAHNRQDIYLRALKTLPIVEVYFGKFLTQTVRLPLANGTGKVEVRKTEEKRSDVNIAVQMLKDGFKDLYDLAVLVSNDSDLTDALEVVSTDLGKKVGILNPQKNQSKELANHAFFSHKIQDRLLRESQFPETLRDSVGEFHMPVVWR